MNNRVFIAALALVYLSLSSGVSWALVYDSNIVARPMLVMGTEVVDTTRGR
jgi:hypothetical protein